MKNNSKYLILESGTYSIPRNIKKTPLGTIVFEQVLQEVDRQNQNKRTYPKQVLMAAMESPNFKRTMGTGNMFGEAGHPTEKDIAVQSQINPMKLAVKIIKTWWEGDLLIGLCETANTDVGKNMAGIIEQGTQVGFSLRAQGDVMPTANGSIVKPGLNIVTWDWVMCPSHDKAYMREIQEEHANGMQFESVSFMNESYISEQMDLSEGLIATDELVDSKIIYENFIDNGAGEMISLNKMYFYDKEDKIMLETYSNSAGTVQLKNGDNIKKVNMEDHLIKNIRETLVENVVVVNSKKEFNVTMKKNK